MSLLRVGQCILLDKLIIEGKATQPKNRYKIFGTNINYLIKSNILSTPNYIKIDVDGIEHLILEGANNYLDNSEIRSISIELNENFKDQFNSVLKIMDKSKFSIKHKKHSSLFDNSISFQRLLIIWTLKKNNY